MTIQQAPQPFPFDDYTALPLRGDASARTYARLLPRPGSAARSAIRMTFEGDGRRAEVRNFIAATELFRAMYIPVAGILHADENDGVVVVEDLGDILLEDIAGRPEFPRHLYEAAVDTLLAIQVRSRGREAGWPAVFGRAIDAEKIAFELDYLKRHGLERGRGLTAAEARAVDRAFALIIDEVAALPRVLNHRDYHSRNIMVAAGRIAIVDHQDALMASPFYDLASLLHDSYVVLPREVLEALRDRYLAGARSAGVPVPESDKLALGQFDIVALQRNVKALGTFAFQGLVRGRKYFLESIPKTLSDVRGNPAAARSELAPLADLLEDRLGDLP